MTELMIALSALATTFWRFVGVMLSRDLDESSRVFRFFSCVSYAIMAALVIQMTLDPQSRLADSEAWERLVALGAALAAYAVSRHNIAVGTLAGLLAFTLLIYR